jgi:hypothetical protein
MYVAEAAVGASASRAARTAASPMAWICVVIPASAARAASDARASGGVVKIP